MGKLVDLTRRGREFVPGLMPLVPFHDGPAPAWRIERIGEDRFRLFLAAAGLAAADIEVFIQGGLLHIGKARDGRGAYGFDWTFLLLEPLTITRVELREGELVVELERDHATPCLAVPPPVPREAAAALALAA